MPRVGTDTNGTDIFLSLFYLFVLYFFGGGGCGGASWSWLYGSWIADSVYHHYIYEVESRSWRCLLDTTLCDKSCQWFTPRLWFSLGSTVSCSNTTDRPGIAEILFTGVLNNIPITVFLTCLIAQLRLLYVYRSIWFERSCRLNNYVFL